MPDTDPGRQARKVFDLDVKSLLDPESSAGISLSIFVRTRLRNFHLNQFYDLTDVLNEAYCRGVKLIESGESIRNTSAWIRSTAYNIIREWSREQKRTQPLESNLEFKVDVALAKIAPVPENVIDEHLMVVQTALQQLSHRDKIILSLRFEEGLSWQEIGEQLQASGERPQKEATLRKRGERAIKNLRTMYHSILSAEFPSR
jgi:RNA polymerase sigma factor (sigma-70 family)